jgi:hypothetical protein
MASPEPKSRVSRMTPPKAKRAAQSTLTTALMMDADAAIPKGMIGFTFRTPSSAATALAGKPSKLKPLLQQYGQALAESREAGKSVSFRVDVDPSGGATVTPVAGPADAAERYPVEEVDEISPGLGRALEAARKRGSVRAAEVLSGDDMLSADAFAKLLGTTRMTVNTKRQNGQLLGLDGAKRGFRFPEWQLGAEGKPYPELKSLHELLGGPWALYRFLVQPHGELDGLTGREALERGRGQVVLEAAESIGRGDFR